MVPDTAVITHRFDYHDDDGNVVAQKLRVDLGDGEKTFVQRQRIDSVSTADRLGGAVYQADGRFWVDRIGDEWIKALPFRPDPQQVMLNGAMPRRLYVTEGERDANAIIEQGEVATTLLQYGFEKPWAEYFRGHKGTVYVVVDNDGPGAAQGIAKRRALADVGVTVELLRPPEEFKDARDMLDAGQPLTALRTVTVRELKKIATKARANGEPGVRQTGDDYPEFVKHLGDGMKVSRKLIALPKKKPGAKRKRKRWQPHKRLPPPNVPMGVARAVQADLTENGDLTIYRWRGAWWEWHGSYWSETSDAEVRSRLYHITEKAIYATKEGSVPWAPNTSRITNLADALKAVVYLDDHIDAGSWLEGSKRRTPSGTVVACANCLLEIETRRQFPHNPLYFNLVAVPFDYDPDAPEPEQWLSFLDEQWKDDPEQTDVLQEWFGYVISGRTDLQKILGIFGATRSGKGTIGRVLSALVGEKNVAAPTLKGLGSNFGLQPLIGKSLALVSDVRLGNRADIETVVERLLSISGEDELNIDRKNREQWIGRLSARLVLMSNEEPAFRDASGAIAHRFLALKHKVSFLGREDPKLLDRLLAELPGIFNWALDGLDRLQQQGRFTDSTSSEQMVDRMKGAASPVAEFVDEMCVVKPDLWVQTDELWGVWQAWAEDSRSNIGTKESFFRRLRGYLPEIEKAKRGGSRGMGQKRGYLGIGLRRQRRRKSDGGPRVK
jgi:putative DNA primase/helicase